MQGHKGGKVHTVIKLISTFCTHRWWGPKTYFRLPSHALHSYEGCEITRVQGARAQGCKRRKDETGTRMQGDKGARV